MMMLHSDAAWEMGHGGEQAVKDWLQRFRFGVIALSEIASGGAPSLSGADDAVVLPDFQVSGEGFTRYVEVKTKTEATLHHNTNTWNHGLELRLYRQYLEIAKRTGLEVWLCFFEVRRRLVLLQDIAHLHRVKRPYYGDKMGPGGMVFFPCDEFEWYYGPSEIRFKTLEPRAARTLAQPEPPTTQGPAQLDLWK